MGSRSTQRGLSALVLFALQGTAAIAACREGIVELRSGASVAQFNVEIADSNDERAQGLMNREKLGTSSGMLFVYESPRQASFWMKNTLIPLDMIFVDPTGLVARVHAGAKPLDTTRIDGGENVALVLEINGGLAARLGIQPGSQMRHPAIDQANAVWRCDSE